MRLKEFAGSKRLVVALVLVSLLLIVVGNHVKGIGSSLRDHGVWTTAKIEKVRWKEKRGRPDRDDWYRLDVSFQAQDGRRFSDSFPVSSELGKTVRYDDALTTVKVIYLPEDPKTALLETAFQENNDTVVQWFYLAGAIFLVAVLLLVYQLLTKSRVRRASGNV